VPWIRKPGFKLVAVKDVRRVTGLELSELLSRQNIQRLTRRRKRCPRRVRARRTPDRRAGGLSRVFRVTVDCWLSGDTSRLDEALESLATFLGAERIIG